MGMGYGACFAETIEEKNVAKGGGAKVKVLLKQLRTLLPDAGDLESLAREVAQCEDNHLDEHLDDPKKAEQAREVYGQLCDTFERVNKGLHLALGFHDADQDGDRYDDINGAYWELSGVFQPTPAAKKLMRKGVKIERKFFVSFG